MNKTLINWADYSLNPFVGCSRISSGCSQCYAILMANRLQAMGVKGYEGVTYKTPQGKLNWTGKINFIPERLLDKKLNSKKPMRIFVNSMSDLFHESLSFKQIEKVFNTMSVHPQHTYLILTKRFRRSIEFFDWWDEKLKDYGGYELPNWMQIGYSGSTQKDLDGAMNYLHKIKGSVKWLSIEPMLQVIDISKYDYAPDWIVVGCESGNKRRVCYKEWIYDLAEQCKFYKIPIWVKQMQIGLKREVVEDINLFPKELQLRQLPK